MSALRRRSTPAERQQALAQAKAYLAAVYQPCGACGGQRAGPIHRTSVRLWTGRHDRALANDGTDPESGVTAAEAERHLVAIRENQAPEERRG